MARELQNGGEKINSFPSSGPTPGCPARPPSEPKATAASLQGSMRLSAVSEKSSCCQQKSAAKPWPRKSVSSKFQVMLTQGLFVDPSLLSANLEDILLTGSHSILSQLVHSVKDEEEISLSDQAFAMAASADLKQFTFTFDSASEVHLLTLEAATQFFSAHQASNLRILGVSGTATRADLMGHLIIAVEDPTSGVKYHIDLGQSHGMKSCPMNLISVSLLIKVGAIVHFEKGNCFFQAYSGAGRIPFTQSRGMFHLSVERSNLIPEVDDVRHSYMVNGFCFATSGDLQLWHRRLRHMPKERLLQIFKHNLVDGFKLTGRITTTCDCDTCRQAKISRWATPREHPFEESTQFIGHTVRSDVKSLPFESFQGFKYVINFID